MTSSENINPSVFIIILNYNGFEDTKKCLESLLSCSYANKNIILVDNASTDNSASLLKNSFPGIPLLISEINKGYAGGLNIGIKYALENNADFILVSNNDVVFTNNFLEPMIALSLEDENIGIVSPKVLYTHNPQIIYCAGGELSYLKCGGVAKYQGKSNSEFGNENREINLAEGCCFLVKRNVFEKVGLMNEKYFLYFEEVDFSLQVIKQFKIMYCSQSIIYHKAGAGYSWAQYSPTYYYYYTRNRLWLFRNKNFIYSLYVILFSLFNSIAKSFVLLLNMQPV